MNNYTGGCHCGAVRYAVTADLAGAITCNCSNCQMRGLILTFVPAESFSLTKGEEALTEYRFNKKMIAHQLCTVCGIEAFANAQNAEGAPMYAINIRTLDGVDPLSLETTPVDGKSF